MEVESVVEGEGRERLTGAAVGIMSAAVLIEGLAMEELVPTLVEEERDRGDSLRLLPSRFVVVGFSSFFSSCFAEIEVA